MIVLAKISAANVLEFLLETGFKLSSVDTFLFQPPTNQGGCVASLPSPRRRN